MAKFLSDRRDPGSRRPQSDCSEAGLCNRPAMGRHAPQEADDRLVEVPPAADPMWPTAMHSIPARRHRSADSNARPMGARRLDPKPPDDEAGSFAFRIYEAAVHSQRRSGAMMLEQNDEWSLNPCGGDE